MIKNDDARCGTKTFNQDIHMLFLIGRLFGERPFTVNGLSPNNEFHMYLVSVLGSQCLWLHVFGPNASSFVINICEQEPELDTIFSM